MTNKVVLFDFDGTLADTFPHIKSILNNLALKHKFNQLSDNEIDMLRSKSAKEVMQYTKVSWWRMPFIARDFKKEAHKIITKVSIFPGMKTILKELSEEGMILAVLTSNSRKNVEDFLQQNDSEKYIKEIFPDIGMFGKGKAMKKAVKSLNGELNESFYIGDEVRDVDAAKKIDLKVIAVDWGFNTNESLKNANADFVVSSPKELLPIIKNN